MAEKFEINTHEKECSNVEFARKQINNGLCGELPIVDGRECYELMFGYVSQKDKEACEKVIREALEATNGNTYEALNYIMTACNYSAHDIQPSKELVVNGVSFVVDYEHEKVYLGTDEVLDISNLTSITDEDTLLGVVTDKLKLWLIEHTPEPTDCDCDDCEDDDECGCTCDCGEVCNCDCDCDDDCSCCTTKSNEELSDDEADFIKFILKKCNSNN